MDGRQRGAEQPRRRFITRLDVQDAAARGATIQVGPRDVVTDEAAQRAEDLGVRIERGAGDGARPTDPAALRRAVRAAVVAELGHAPATLDQVIDRVLKGRGLG